jgi:hypothetical protein
MYIWNVPMPEDEDNANLHWKKEVPTVGLQLISTGHSLADAYMAFDVDEYAKLAVLTGDDHYKEVAAILLITPKECLVYRDVHMICLAPVGSRSIGALLPSVALDVKEHGCRGFPPAI